MRALLVDVPDPGFAAELEEWGIDVLPAGGTADLVFLGVHSLADLARIGELKARLPKDGALWVIRPKGPGTPVPERETMKAGLATGLVDVKVVSFSDTHSALKYVHRLRDR